MFETTFLNDRIRLPRLLVTGLAELFNDNLIYQNWPEVSNLIETLFLFIHDACTKFWNEVN